MKREKTTFKEIKKILKERLTPEEASYYLYKVAEVVSASSISSDVRNKAEKIIADYTEVN